MLVIVSDLHFTDGTCAETVSPDAVGLFAERLRGLVFNASRRSDGRYLPVESIDLVLLGDVLDVSLSKQWLATSVRPWHDSQSPDFVRMVEAVTRSILERNEAAFSGFRAIAQGQAFRIPPADVDGHPAGDAVRDCLTVPVRIHYVCGNHDWYYHLAGAAYDRIRGTIREAIGLHNPGDGPFPYDIEESGRLLDICLEHRVYPRHGDRFDAFNFSGDRDGPSLGDAIVIDLISRFLAEVESRLGDRLPDPCRLSLQLTESVRPLIAVPVWVRELLQQTCPDYSVRQEVQAIWGQSIDHLLALDFVRALDTRHPFDNVDRLQLLFKIPADLPPFLVSRVLAFVDRFSTDHGAAFQEHAAEDRARHGGVRHVVYGHTHYHEVVPLGMHYSGGRQSSCLYLNSGTWKRVQQMGRVDKGRVSFGSYKTMTYLAFYANGERSGLGFEAWSGGLG
jgi:hypothetical protein